VTLSALAQRRPTPKFEGTQKALEMVTRRRGEEPAKSVKMRKCEKGIEIDWKGNLTGAPAADAKISGVWKGEEIEKCEEKQKKKNAFRERGEKTANPPPSQPPQPYCQTSACRLSFLLFAHSRP